MNHSHISRPRGHIVHILYVFAQFPMIFRHADQLFARPGSARRVENEFDGSVAVLSVGRYWIY